jgi:hypothetical protein
MIKLRHEAIPLPLALKTLALKTEVKERLMSRRHAVATGCVLAFAALTLTAALAAAEPQTAVPQAAPPTWQPPSPEIIEAIQRDLGLTREQAVTRLRNEARLTGVEAQLRARLGDRFGGSWFLGALAQTLVVATTSSSDIPQITAAGARPQVVKLSLAQLTLIRQKLDKALSADPRGGSVRYVDVMTNKVVVLSMTPAETRKLISTVDVDATAVTVVFSTEKPWPRRDGRDDGRPPLAPRLAARSTSR